jgi:hypothetical protein
MFETLNAILGNEMLRYSLLMGSGALLSYTLHPLPSAIDTFASSSFLKFGTLFLFGLLMAHPLNVSKFMIVFLAALVIMILFEYFRQIDKGRAGVDAAKEATKEFMWGEEPTASYPGATPYADPRMGIPQFLPDGKTPAVTFVGYGGGRSNTGDFTTERMANPLEATLMGIRDLSLKGYNMANEMSKNIAVGVGLSEHMADPLQATLIDIKNLSKKGFSLLSGERFENPFKAVFTGIYNASQQGINMASQMGSGIASSVGLSEQMVNPLETVFTGIYNASQEGINMVTNMSSSMADSLGPGSEHFGMPNPLSFGFNEINNLAQRGMDTVASVGQDVAGAIGLKETLVNPLDALFMVPISGPKTQFVTDVVNSVLPERMAVRDPIVGGGQDPADWY